jgi:hypothetical protein
MVTRTDRPKDFETDGYPGYRCTFRPRIMWEPTSFHSPVNALMGVPERDYWGGGPGQHHRAA